MYKTVAGVLLISLLTSTVYAEGANKKISAVKRLWEYSYSEFISITKLNNSETQLVKNQEAKNGKASLLLALNCIKPEQSNKYKAFYSYRCKNSGFYPVSHYINEDIYLLAFVNPEHHKMAIGYIDNYLQFLNTISKPDIGYPVEASKKEFLMEIKSFIEKGGYPSKKALNQDAQ